MKKANKRRTLALSPDFARHNWRFCIEWNTTRSSVPTVKVSWDIRPLLTYRASCFNSPDNRMRGVAECSLAMGDKFPSHSLTPKKANGRRKLAAYCLASTFIPSFVHWLIVSNASGFASAIVRLVMISFDIRTAAHSTMKSDLPDC